MRSRQTVRSRAARCRELHGSLAGDWGVHYKVDSRVRNGSWCGCARVRGDSGSAYWLLENSNMQASSVYLEPRRQSRQQNSFFRALSAPALQAFRPRDRSLNRAGYRYYRDDTEEQRAQVRYVEQTL